MFGSTPNCGVPGRLPYSKGFPADSFCEDDLVDALIKQDKIEDAIKLYDKKLSEGLTPYIMCSNSVAESLKDRNVLKLGESGEEIASNLYDKLLEGEKIADVIIAISFGKEDGVFAGIMNRLNKSCG